MTKPRLIVDDDAQVFRRIFGRWSRSPGAIAHDVAEATRPPLTPTTSPSTSRCLTLGMTLLDELRRRWPQTAALMLSWNGLGGGKVRHPER